MKNRRMKVVAPLLTFVLAVGGAFMTSAFSTVDKFAPIEGYIDSPISCDEPVQCSDDPTQPVCRDADGKQVYGMDTPTTCALEVYLFTP